MSVTAKGRKWEILHSLWIGWTFTLFFYSVAFFYIGFRADQQKWTLWGVAYLAPFIMFMASLFIWGPDSWQSNATGIPTLLLSLVAIGHAFKVRKEYLLRLANQSKDTIGRYTVSKSRHWEKVHLLWIGWTFTLVLNWVAFFYIGWRARQYKWALWGLFYLMLLIGPAIVDPEAINPRWNYVDTLGLLGGAASIVHALLIRKQYLQRLETLPHMRNDREATLKQRIEAETPQREDTSTQGDRSDAQVRQTVEHNGSQTASVAPKESARSLTYTTPPATESTNVPQQVPSTSIKSGQAPSVWRSGDEIEYLISSSYPFPIAFGFRSLGSIVDHRDLYREQLRIAENILAFLASVSLTLLRKEDQQEADIDLKAYWRSGISPGDWRDIVGRCSKVFAGYKENPLALEISRLNIRSEKKDFGRDIAKLIQVKNDYKHDRGPIVLEDITEASEMVNETLRRCMEKLSFFSDYPIRQVEDFNVSRSGDEVLLKCLRYMGDHPSFPQEEVVFHKGLPRGDLFLDLDGRNWVPLYPFIVPMTCLHCKARETYFIDLWDTRREVARMKSFERGHTINNTDVSEALAERG